MKITDTIALVLKSKGAVKLLSVEPEQSVYEGIEMMAEHEIGALPVISGGKLVGLMSERDYARKCVLLGHPSRETQVGQIMTTPVHFVSPQQTVDECMALMTEHRVRYLPVLEKDALAGMISIGDLVKWVISGQALAIEALEGYITGAYPG